MKIKIISRAGSGGPDAHGSKKEGGGGAFFACFLVEKVLSKRVDFTFELGCFFRVLFGGAFYVTRFRYDFFASEATP